MSAGNIEVDAVNAKATGGGWYLQLIKYLLPFGSLGQ